MGTLNRSLARILRAPLDRRHWRSAATAALVYERPLRDFVGRYVLQRGAYPARLPLRTPTGTIAPELLHPLDTFTVNEIFNLEVYALGRAPSVVVDLGANIGLSELYFLSRNARNVVYGFEPVPRLFAQLERNTAPFAGRVVNRAVAVSAEAGEVEMGIEPSGRYGGIGVRGEAVLRVPAVGVNEALRPALEAHGVIDVLKIDIEGVEEAVLEAADPRLLARIRTIYVEAGDDTTLYPRSLRDRFDLAPRRGICRYVNRAPPAGGAARPLARGEGT
jgi:FkbM family methyltransferase